MALIIEDGTGKDDATSFASVVETRAFAAARGFTTLPVADAEVEALLVKAGDYLASLEFLGSKTSRTQSLPFPRKGIVLDDEEVPDDEIPAEVKRAQMQLAMEGVTVSLLPSATGRRVKKEKVDVLETEYEYLDDGRPVFHQVLSWLSAWMAGGADGLGINAVIIRG